MSKGISETAFASQVEDLLNLYLWRWCHFRPALTGAGWRTAMKGSDPDGYKGKGIPDYICVRPPRLLFAELKDEVKPTTPEQDAWLGDLKALEAEQIKCRYCLSDFKLEVYLWRPSQIEEIAEILK